jgi:CBS domain-containing protein
MLAAGAEAVAVLEADDRLRGVLTRETLLRWVTSGGGDAPIRRELEPSRDSRPGALQPRSMA